MKKGFTLVELLVVVLIIGILATIAVPQYKKAILKTRLHQGVSLVASLYQAQQSYYLANGKYTKNLKELDITLPKDCGENTNPSGYMHKCNAGRIYNDSSDNKIYFLVSNQAVAYVYFMEDNYNPSADYTFKAGTKSCQARPANKLAQDVCINMGGKYVGESKAWKYYALDDSN